MSRIEMALRKAQMLKETQVRPAGREGSICPQTFGTRNSRVPTGMFENLRRELGDLRRPRIGICSRFGGEGTSAITAYLARQFSLDKKVLAIDCNLNKPKLQDLLGTGPGAGTGEILLGEKRLRECLLPVPGEPNLTLLPAGRCGADAVPFLGTTRSERLFEEVKEGFELTLFDAPSDEDCSGTLGLCLQADGVLWVVREDSPERNQISDTLELYREAGVRFLGAVLNRAGQGTVTGLRSRRAFQKSFV